ncbi:radical SAM protein [Candidatus Neomarinimicrobiota bacterium]
MSHAGTARLVADAQKEESRHATAWLSLLVRSVLNRVNSDRVGFEWSINPYRGCEFGCFYCYARYTHSYLDMAGNSFEKHIYIKRRVGRSLWNDLLHNKVVGKHIAIGTATDPYQPVERRFGVTRSILETLLMYARLLPGGGGLDLSITTKSNLVLKDMEVLQTLQKRNRLRVNITITTLDTGLARILEPRAPRPDLRLAALQKLRAGGIPAGVFIAPILPGITDISCELDQLVQATRKSGAQWIVAQPAFLTTTTKATFFPLLAARFPNLEARYRYWYKNRGQGPKGYCQVIRRELKALKALHGFKSELHPDNRPTRLELQPLAIYQGNQLELGL